MRSAPPAGFDARDFLKEFYVFQEWDIFPGHSVPAPKNVNRVLHDLRFPADLRGMRILDIAPWNGFFSFECARRGADHVVSLGPEDPSETGYRQVQELLEISSCEYRQGSVYNLDPEEFGRFDAVLFLGLIYHLRHPLLALDRIFDVCDGTLFVDAPCIDKLVYDRTLTPSYEQLILAAPAIHRLPMLYFTKANETGDLFNWFIPNRAALSAMVESSGFEILHAGDDGGGWAWLGARKTRRDFVVGLEGYNPGAARAQ